MKWFACLLFLLAGPALAGERLLGRLTSTGTAVTNISTAVAFFVPLNSKLSIQCDAAGYFLGEGLVAVTSTNGILLTANQFFQTTVAGFNGVRSATAGASLGGMVIRWISVTGTANCTVWERTGLE